MSPGSRKSKENPHQVWVNRHLKPALAASPRRVENFATSSGIELRDLDSPENCPTSNQAYQQNIGYPGQYPFTRGIHATMYRSRLWSMRQYSGFGTAAETNRRFRDLLAQGTSGLSVAFDLPTQMGFDSDHQLAKGEVGRVGVAIDTVQDMEQLFAEIPLADVSTSMTINATAFILLGFYLTVAKKRGVAWNKLRGTTQNDILKEYIARGTYIYPPQPALKIVTDIMEFCRDNVPQWNTISVSGYHIREAGSTAVQELAFTLANGICYLEQALSRGLQIDEVAPRVAFFFNCHNNFLEEIAKFRAARRLWAKIVRQRFAAKDPRSMMLRFHTQTAGSSLSAQQPLNNAVRTAIQALAAVLGGTQSLHTNGFDEAICLPTRDSAILALRTQQIIAHETSVADVVDPLGGSHTIEYLTEELAARAEKLIEEIEAQGGMVAAIERELPQKYIEEAAFLQQKAMETGEARVIGVNCFTEEESCEGSDAREAQLLREGTKPRILKVDPRLEKEQVERLTALKRRRTASAVNKALQELQEAAEQGRNIMPAVCGAAETEVSVGEISDILRKVFGQYRQPV